jgi:hypothetical protein
MDLLKKASMDNYLRQLKEQKDLRTAKTLDKVQSEDYMEEADMDAAKASRFREPDDFDSQYEQGDDEAFLASPEGKEMRSQEARKQMLKMISDRYKNMGE